MQLSQLAAEDGRVALLGAVKETGVADAELLKFYDQYFRHQIYLDEKWNIYKYMGGKKLSWPHLIRGALRSEKRYAAKGIENKKFGGDLHTQGGLLIFDKRGNLRYHYPEQYGHELDTKVITEAIAEIRRTSAEARRLRGGSSITGSSVCSSGFRPCLKLFSNEDAKRSHCETACTLENSIPELDDVLEEESGW